MVDFFIFCLINSHSEIWGEPFLEIYMKFFQGVFSFVCLIVFSVDETYIGNIRSIEMEVKLSDQTLVHLN